MKLANLFLLCLDLCLNRGLLSGTFAFFNQALSCCLHFFFVLSLFACSILCQKDGCGIDSMLIRRALY